MFLTKTFLEFLTISKNVIIFELKASREKMNTALTWRVRWHIPNCGCSFKSNTCVFLKNHFMNFLPFQHKASRRKMNTALNWKTTFIYAKVGLFISKYPMSFSHKSISWNSYLFQMNMLIFQYKASTEKVNTVLTSNNRVTYPD